MLARQVFHDYAPGSAHRASGWSYCPACGSALAAGPNHLACSGPACDFRHYLNPTTAVSVLTPDDAGRVLLCRRQPGLGGGKWCLPCGYVDYPEDFLTAARREVREETGLEIVVDGLLSVVSNFFSPQVHSIVTVLLGRVTGGALAAGDDAIDAGWFDPHDSAIDWAFEADRHIVSRYFAGPFTGAPVDARYAS